MRKRPLRDCISQAVDHRYNKLLNKIEMKTSLALRPLVSNDDHFKKTTLITNISITALKTTQI